MCHQPEVDLLHPQHLKTVEESTRDSGRLLHISTWMPCQLRDAAKEQVSVGVWRKFHMGIYAHQSMHADAMGFSLGILHQSILRFNFQVWSGGGCGSHSLDSFPLFPFLPNNGYKSYQILKLGPEGPLSKVIISFIRSLNLSKKAQNIRESKLWKSEVNNL